MRGVNHWLFALLTVVVIPFGNSSAEMPETRVDEELIVAMVGKRGITSDQLLTEWQRTHPNQMPQRSEIGSIEQSLEVLVEHDQMLTAANASGFSTSPKVLKAIRRLIVDLYMQENYLPKLAAIELSDKELERYYQDHQADYQAPTKRRMAWIKLPMAKNISDGRRQELLQKAKSARDEATRLPDATLSFGSVAVKYSADQATRYRGGEVGWLGEEGHGRWPVELNQAVNTLSTGGQISEIIETSDGFYLLKLIEVKTARTHEFSEIKGRITHDLMREKREQVRLAFFQDLAGEIQVVRHTELIEEWLEKLGAERPVPPSVGH